MLRPCLTSSKGAGDSKNFKGLDTTIQTFKVKIRSFDQKGGSSTFVCSGEGIIFGSPVFRGGNFRESVRSASSAAILCVETATFEESFTLGRHRFPVHGRSASAFSFSVHHHHQIIPNLGLKGYRIVEIL